MHSVQTTLPPDYEGGRIDKGQGGGGGGGGASSSGQVS